MNPRLFLAWTIIATFVGSIAYVLGVTGYLKDAIKAIGLTAATAIALMAIAWAVHTILDHLVMKR